MMFILQHTQESNKSATAALFPRQVLFKAMWVCVCVRDAAVCRCFAPHPPTHWHPDDFLLDVLHKLGIVINLDFDSITSDRSRDSLPAVGVASGWSRGSPLTWLRAQDRRWLGRTWLGLFTQLWGSPGPGEREDVYRVSLIIAASEEINRQGPAGMLQPLPLV